MSIVDWLILAAVLSSYIAIMDSIAVLRKMIEKLLAPDPRSTTTRAAVQSEQGGINTDSSYDEFEGTTFNPKKYGSSRPNRSDGG